MLKFTAELIIFKNVFRDGTDREMKNKIQYTGYEFINYFSVSQQNIFRAQFLVRVVTELNVFSIYYLNVNSL